VITHEKQQITFYCETISSTSAALIRSRDPTFEIFWPFRYLYCDPPTTGRPMPRL